MEIIKRAYPIPQESFFLFGPRGVGKSTWIRENINVAASFDLLHHKTFLDLQRNPSELEAKVSHLRPKDFVAIDEIQKLPALLDEVHRLIELRKFRFALSGSSARKLKRVGANLLAGRAHTLHMFPFSLSELRGLVEVDEAVRHGTLPIVLRNRLDAEDALYSYVETYLREEIKEEALVRSLDGFSRFLEISGQLHAQVINFENVARETGKPSSTIQNWYQILEETLLGFRLKPFRPGFKTREIGHAKFYWFDGGVARVAGGQSLSDVDALWLGACFEGLVLNELMIFNEVSRKRRPLSYYAVPGAGEIDFVVETQKKTIQRPSRFLSIEAKFTSRWKRDFEGPSRALRQVAGKEKHTRMLGVYMGSEILNYDGFEVWPFAVFVEKLYAGEVF